MSVKVGRKKLEITKDIEEEIDEIIELRIQEIEGAVSKLTSNGVWQLNKRIANNPEILRKNGKIFNYYSSDFWSAKYKNKDNYGKARIQYYKNKSDNEILFDGSFDPGIKDIVLAVQDLHSKPDRLVKVLQGMYLEKVKEIKVLKEERDSYKKEYDKEKKLNEMMQGAVYNLFFASSDSRNSLKNVMDLEKGKDKFIVNELEAAVGNRKDFLELIQEPKDKTPEDKTANDKKVNEGTTNNTIDLFSDENRRKAKEMAKKLGL